MKTRSRMPASTREPLISVGSQAISFAQPARRFGTAHELMPPSRFSALLNPMTRERLLIAAAVFFFGGIAGLVGCSLQWASLGFEPLDYLSMLRVLLASVAATALAAQPAYTTFLSSFLEMPTR
jgi:hypothetical protein